MLRYGRGRDCQPTARDLRQWEAPCAMSSECFLTDEALGERSHRVTELSVTRCPGRTTDDGPLGDSVTSLLAMPPAPRVYGAIGSERPVSRTNFWPVFVPSGSPLAT